MERWSLIMIIMVFFSTSCKQHKAEGEKVEMNTDSLRVANAFEGKKLMEQKCYLCHSPTAPENAERVGPPMIAVKAHYKQEFTTREAFIDSIIAFVLNPKQNRTKLKGAVKRFGPMPMALYNKEEIEKIAAYMYDYQVEEPQWFEEHWSSHGFPPYTNTEQPLLLTDAEKPTYAEIAMSYALGTKQVLGANLMGTIQKKGVPAALTFCHERAYPLTDSMSVAFSAKIKRVSDRPRNPKNKANSIEEAHIQTFKQALEQKTEMLPMVADLGEEVQFYAPIITNAMCLKCHGDTKTDVSLDVQNLLLEKYPNDKATGYRINEVRGIWSITFDKQENVKF